MQHKSIPINQLPELYGLKISKLASRMIQNNELAKEAAQEVWYEIMKSIDSFRGDSELSTWIYTIARRTILQYIKGEKRYSSRELNGHFDLEPIAFDGLEEDKKQWVKEKCDYCLTAFCHCLNDESRLIFLFRDIAELEYAQIGQIMDMSEDAARKITSRSRNKVRNFMNRNCVLYHPEGECRCRIRKHVIAVNLDAEYSKLSKAANLIEWYQKFDQELPRKNFWEKFI